MKAGQMAPSAQVRCLLSIAIDYVEPQEQLLREGNMTYRSCPQLLPRTTIYLTDS